MEYFFFLFLYAAIIITSFSVIATRNPVVSMLYLILVFLQVSLLFLCLGAEFLFILFLIVYVGAVSILFLFVIMLLNLRVVESYNMLYNYTPVGLFIGFFFFLFLVYFTILDFSSLTMEDFFMKDNFTNYWVSFLFFKSNITAVGELLYNYCNHYFILVALLLLVALLGVVYLTLDLARPSSSKATYDYRRASLKSIFDINC